MPPRKRPPESPRESSVASERVANAKEAMGKFTTLAGKLVKVTHSELERAERRYQTTRAANITKGAQSRRGR